MDRMLMPQSNANADSEHAPVDVVIVGGGVAGLTAARRLARRNVSFVVLEARDRVGGRTLSQKLGRDWIDLGGQWMGPRQERLKALAGELGVHTFPQYCAGKKILSQGGKILTYKGDLPWLSLRAQWELLMADRRLKSYLKDLPLEAPWTARRALEWDSQTVETW